MKTKPPIGFWKNRPIKVAGHTHRLFVSSLQCRCGDVIDGVGFEFEGQGGWVVDLEDLKQIVLEASSLPPSQPTP